MTFPDPAHGNPVAASGMTIKGTLATDVTTWIDPDGHRVMKTHSTADDDATIDLKTTAPPPSPTTPSAPQFTGPITAKGQATTDLTPA